MAKKKTEIGKKETAHAKNAVQAQDLETMPEEIKTLAATRGHSIGVLPQQLMNRIMSDVTELMEDFTEFTDNNLTPAQRSRKIGAGIRNYGFMEKVADLAAANPEYAQFFSIQNLRNSIRNIDMCRDIVLLLQAFARAVSNAMLVYSDEAFTMSLIFYNMVREMSRRGDPVAMELFNTLRPFFRRRRPADAEPTTKELERDLHALLHGTKEGKIVVENETPVIKRGARKIVDDVHKSKAALKESAEEEITE